MDWLNTIHPVRICNAKEPPFQVDNRSIGNRYLHHSICPVNVGKISLKCEHEWEIEKEN